MYETNFGEVVVSFLNAVTLEHLSFLANKIYNHCFFGFTILCQIKPFFALKVIICIDTYLQKLCCMESNSRARKLNLGWLWVIVDIVLPITSFYYASSWHKTNFEQQST